MTIDSRRQKIVEILQTKGFCNITNLAKELEVSEVTIRHDLNLLEERGRISRIHGGAIPLSANDVHAGHFHARLAVNAHKKRLIARHAAAFVQNQETNAHP
jgi:DeoR/GlpR family transcriptional regulator of sugar metabolism